jgi:glutamate formiminotransferase
MSLVECIPNVSEGRRDEVLAACVDAVRRTGVKLLNVHSDPSNNRSVLSVAGRPDALMTAVLALVEQAVTSIDLRRHQGVHPRVGAVDVVPFVPLHDTPMTAAVALARQVGAEVARQFGIPVFLYAEAATSPDRRRLERIRRGQFEGLATRLREPIWQPDYGPAVPHPAAGATVVGARGPLIAYNVNLATDDVSVAREIARAVRESSGGLPHVKAMGVLLAHRGLAQISMNLTDYRQTSLQTVFARVSAEAARLRTDVLESEIIGLVPEAALTPTSASDLKIANFGGHLILEHQLRSAGLGPGGSG